jgi:hypothetical protein
VSDWEEIFFDVEEPLTTAAQMLATALGLRTRLRASGVDAWGEPDETGLVVPVFGTIELNDYAETNPETVSDTSIFDDMPYIFELRVAQSNCHRQSEVAASIHRRIAEVLGWRSALTRGFAVLRATFDTKNGYREFPADTLSDATHADRWR